MPASIVFGEKFEPVYDANGHVRDIVSVNGSYEFVGRVKLQQALEICESLGIPSAAWPVYEVGDTASVPLTLAITACENLRPRLLRIREAEIIKEDDFLQLAISHLESGDLFFIVM